MASVTCVVSQAPDIPLYLTNKKRIIFNLPCIRTMQKDSITSRDRNARRAGGYYQVTELGFGFTSSYEHCSRADKLYPTDWGDYCSAAQSEASMFPINDLDDIVTIARDLRYDKSTISNHDRRSVVSLVTGPAIAALNDRGFTVNDAGIYSLGPDCTPIPASQPVAIDGTAIQLDCGTTAVVIGGSTGKVQPIIVTVRSAVGFSGSDTKEGDMNLATQSASSDSTPRPPLSMTSPTSQVTSMGNALKPLRGKTSDRSKALILILVAIGV
jgi:hypothetical protein